MSSKLLSANGIPKHQSKKNLGYFISQSNFAFALDNQNFYSVDQSNCFSTCVAMRAQGNPSCGIHCWRIVNKILECMICKYTRRTLLDILRHIRDVDPHFEGLLSCGVDNWLATLRKYKSLHQHMYKIIKVN